MLGGSAGVSSWTAFRQQICYLLECPGFVSDLVPDLVLGGFVVFDLRRVTAVRQGGYYELL